MTRRPARVAASLLGLLLASCASGEALRTREPAAEPGGPYTNTLRWKTASEVDNFGFDVYRSESEDGPFERVTERPVRGAGTTDVPQQYVWVDARIDPRRAYFYYVESIAMDGARERFTPVIRAKPKLAPEGEAPEPPEAKAPAGPGPEDAQDAAAPLEPGASAEPGREDWPPGFHVARQRWESPLGPGQSVRVENPHGDVRAGANAVQRLEVYAVIQSESRDPLRPEVGIEDAPDGLRVAVRYTGSPGGGEDATPVRRVDLTLFVPAGSPLHARAEHGAIEVRGLTSDVTAATTGGDISVQAAGVIDAHTTSGAIDAVLESGAWTRAPSFETRTGDVTLRLPADAALVVRACTRGEINTDYPAEIEQDGGSRIVRAVTPGDGREVRIRSVEGDVRILAR